jgi:hypothetical protein
LPALSVANDALILTSWSYPPSRANSPFGALD